MIDFKFLFQNVNCEGSLVLVDQGYHAELGSAQSISAIIFTETSVENEERLVTVENPAEIPYHLLFS